MLRVVLLLLAAAAAPAAAPPVAEPASAARHFVELLSQQKFAAAEELFDATMKGALPEAKLSGVWSQVSAQAGAWKSIDSTRAERLGVYDAIFVTCTFERARLDVKVVFDASGAIAGLFFLPASPAPVAWRSPDYCAPAAFDEVKVTVGTGEWELPGTITRPRGNGPFPAVVLVHGSGPHDEDETIGPNKPFADLACGLASRGVAVLRYEKRTHRYGAKMTGDLTVKEATIDDAVLALRLLRATAGIDAHRVFVAGHSLGGMLAPRIAEADPQVAGLAILSGPTRDFDAILTEQLGYLAALAGKTTTAAEVAAQVQELKKAAPAVYWRDLDAYHPAQVAKALRLPILILWGERDYQVTSADLAGWREALAGRADVTIRTYPDLNHLYMTGTGKGRPSEYDRSGHVAGAVVEDLAAFIRR